MDVELLRTDSATNRNAPQTSCGNKDLELLTTDSATMQKKAPQIPAATKIWSC
jgi:hypothetical protein